MGSNLNMQVATLAKEERQRRVFERIPGLKQVGGERPDHRVIEICQQTSLGGAHIGGQACR